MGEVVPARTSTDPTSLIPSHCASIAVTSTLRVNLMLLCTGDDVVTDEQTLSTALLNSTDDEKLMTAVVENADAGSSAAEFYTREQVS